MLPKFIQREHIGDNWFLDFDRGGWVQGWKEEPANEIIFTCLQCQDNYSVNKFTTECPICGWRKEPSLTITTEVRLPDDATPDQVAEAFGNLLAPAGLGQTSEPYPLPPDFIPTFISSSTYDSLEAEGITDMRLYKKQELIPLVAAKGTIRRRV